jgi:hypothetical protein
MNKCQYRKEEKQHGCSIPQGRILIEDLADDHLPVAVQALRQIPASPGSI